MDNKTKNPVAIYCHRNVLYYVDYHVKAWCRACSKLVFDDVIYARKQSEAQDIMKRWLPTNCPYCGVELKETE